MITLSGIKSSEQSQKIKVFVYYLQNILYKTSVSTLQNCSEPKSPIPMKRRLRRRLFNAFAFALLAFAIYLVKYGKMDDSQVSYKTSALKSTASVSKR